MAQDQPLKEFADLLRTKDGVEGRSAVLDQERVEIIRGKDLVRYIAANQDKVTLPIAKGKNPDEQAYEIGSLFLRRNLLIRCDRKFKKPPPGQERLIKFPKKIVRVPPPDAFTFSPTAFYAWTYDKPTSPLVYALSILAAIGVILVCLLPVAPNWVKIGVVYLSAGLLSILLFILAIRSIIALVTWIVTGHTVWVLPNLMADDKPFSELFSPMISISKPDSTSTSSWMIQLASRVAVAVLVAGFGYVLYAHAPESGKVVSDMGRYRDDLFDWMNIERAAIHGDVAKDNNMTSSGGSTSEQQQQQQQEPKAAPVETPHVEDNVAGDADPYADEL